MICLGIQTAVQPYSIALVTEKGLLAEHTLQQNYDASEDLMAWIESLCGSVDTKVSELSAIAVVNGPGSYTGLRIGVTTAKTIGLVFGMPVYGVSSLEALAQAGRVSDTVVVSIMPARKNEFNFQLFSSFEGKITERSERIAYKTDDVVSFLNTFEAPIVVSGYVTETLTGQLDPTIRVVATSLTAYSIARLGCALFQAGEKGALRDVMPYYSHQPLLGGPSGGKTS